MIPTGTSEPSSIRRSLEIIRRTSSRTQLTVRTKLTFVTVPCEGTDTTLPTSAYKLPTRTTVLTGTLSTSGGIGCGKVPSFTVPPP